MMRDNYEDVITLSRPVSKVHKPMSMLDRAAQFSPFAALEGYSDVIAQQQIIYEEKTEISEDTLAHINEVLSLLKRNDVVQIDYYQQGKTLHIEGKYEKMDPIQLFLVVEHQEINFEDIINIDVETK